MSIIGQASRPALPIEKTLADIMLYTLRRANGLWRYDVRIILVALITICSLGVVPVIGQDTPSAPQPTPGPFDLPPSPREQILAPIPSQFEWMNREAPDPLLLEALLGPREDLHSLSFLASLSEEYSDNAEQQADEEARDDYRTILAVETVYRYERGRGFLSLANSLSGEYEARDHIAQLGFVNFTLNTGYRLPRLFLALNERFIREDDLEDASPSGIRRERAIFWRNIVSPQMRYTLSRNTSLGLTYINTIVLNEGEDQGDSITHAVTATFDHRFSRSWAGRLDYTFTYDDEENLEPSPSYAASGELDYAVSRILGLNFRVYWEGIERNEDGEASDVLGAMISARYQLRPGLSLLVGVGPTLFNEEDEAARIFPTWIAGLDGTWQFARHTSLTFNTEQSIENTAGEVSDVGVELRQTVGLQLAHTLSTRIQLSLSADFVHTEVLAASQEADEDRETNFWSTGARVLHTLSPRWSIAVDYLYRRRDSNQNEEDFDENRVVITLASRFSGF